MTADLINMRKVFVDDCEQAANPVQCPECAKQGRTEYLSLFYMNYPHTQLVEKCNYAECMYPFEGFRMRDHGDPRMYRYLFKTAPTAEGAPNGWRHSTMSDLQPSMLAEYHPLTGRKVFVGVLEDEAGPRMCPECAKQGRTEYLCFKYFNFTNLVEKCNHADCMYPFDLFRFREHGDQRIFRIDRATLPAADEVPIDAMNSLHI